MNDKRCDRRRCLPHRSRRPVFARKGPQRHGQEHAGSFDWRLLARDTADQGEAAGGVPEPEGRRLRPRSDGGPVRGDGAWGDLFLANRPAGGLNATVIRVRVQGPRSGVDLAPAPVPAGGCPDRRIRARLYCVQRMAEHRGPQGLGAFRADTGVALAGSGHVAQWPVIPSLTFQMDRAALGPTLSTNHLTFQSLEGRAFDARARQPMPGRHRAGTA